MSSSTETTAPTQRMNLGLASGPNPPWTNIYFDCDCGARYQLGASDECDSVDGTGTAFLAPECWTCGRRNMVTLP